MKNLTIILMLWLSLSGLTVAQQNNNTASNSVAATPKPAPAPKPAKNKKPTVSLETAYKREFAFLAAQKRELQKRLQNYKAKAAKEERKMDGQIAALENSTVENSATIDNLDSQLSEAERTAAALDERSEVLDMTFNQAETTLGNYKIKVKDAPEFAESDDIKIGYIFNQGLTLLQDLGKIRSEKGKFYLHDGKEVDGTIISLGNIAAFGVSNQGGGALAPAGGENFKLWKQPTDDVANALAENQQPDILKLFLFESKNKAIEESPEKTWLGIIESGGFIGWVIVVLGFFGVILILLRLVSLFMNSRDTKSKTEQVMALINKGDLDRAKEVCSAESSAITRVMSSTLRHLKDDREHMEDIIAEAILNESGQINKYGASILVIASVAPLLGLLGTVTGMISTFDIITEFGTGDPKLLSGGISVALVTTQLGLIVAIPTLMCGSLLGAWANDIRRHMEKSALMITNSVLGGNAAGVTAILENKNPTNAQNTIHAA